MIFQLLRDNLIRIERVSCWGYHNKISIFDLWSFVIWLFINVVIVRITNGVCNFGKLLMVQVYVLLSVTSLSAIHAFSIPKWFDYISDIFLTTAVFEK